MIPAEETVEAFVKRMRNIDEVTGISAYGEVPNLAALAIIHKRRIIVWSFVFAVWQRECIEPQGVLIEGDDIQLVFEHGHFEVLLCREEAELLEDDSKSEAGSADGDESDSSDSEDDAPKPSRKKQKTTSLVFEF